MTAAYQHEATRRRREEVRASAAAKPRPAAGDPAMREEPSQVKAAVPPHSLFSESELARAESHKLVQIPAPRVSDSVEPSYYGIPFLKQPTWRFHIAWYFFLDGISAGSFAIGALSGLVGGERLRRLRLSGHEISLLALLPCPAFLIWDLGRPERFYHMLRVWKPKSPMNLGAWLLTAFGAASSAAALQAAGEEERLGPLSGLTRNLPLRTIEFTGLPLALGMSGYGGALLAGTSVPVWNQTPLLSAVFVSSAFASAADALHLEMAARDVRQPELHCALERIAIAAKAAEAVTLGIHIFRSGKSGRALWRGLRGVQTFAGLALGFAATALMPSPIKLQKEPANESARATKLRMGSDDDDWSTNRGTHRQRRICAALLGLAGAFLIRWALIQSGRDAADDIPASHEASRTTATAPGWMRVKKPRHA